MSWRKWIVISVVGGGLLSAGPTSVAVAQFKPFKPQVRQPQPKPQPKPQTQPKGPAAKIRNEKGTIEAIGPDSLKILSEQRGATVTLKMSKSSKYRILGTAELSYLRPGMCVQFIADVDRKKNVLKEEKVSKLTVFTPFSEMGIGMFEELGKAAGAPEVDSLVNWKPYTVSGTVTAVKGNFLTMNVPNFQPALRVELAENVSIKINLDDMRLVKAGDRVQVTKGTERTPDEVSVQSGTITLAEPLTGSPRRAVAPVKKK